MRIERTRDVDYINSVIRHPKIYRHISQDFSPEPQDYDCTELAAMDNIYFLVPMDGNDRCGVFFLHPHTPILLEVHTCILPDYWGRSLEACESLIKWVFVNTECLKIMTLVPRYNRLALKLALASGLEEQGVLTDSFLRNGELMDQTILAVSKPERRA